MTDWPPRQTKIVATLGPASDGESVLGAMLDAGVDVVRINMSHGTQAEHAARVQRVRTLAERSGRPVAVLLDLQGPKIRTGPLVGSLPVMLHTGRTLTITTEAILGTAERVATTFPALPADARPGDRLLLDDGAIELRVYSTTVTDVTCEVMRGGLLGEHKGINLPGVVVSAPALTAKDEQDLQFGLDLDVDYVALSFVRRPDDALEVRRLIRAAGKTIPVIAKLEKPEAIAHLDAIVAAFDGVLVARGDLGVEMPLERVPMLQKQIIRRAQHFGKVVITATQMLESMTASPTPTRAEVSDVANAICDGTDAVMLSAETAIGRYPVEAVAMMSRIARQVEAELPRQHLPTLHALSGVQAVTRAACTLAEEIGARALLVFTRSGSTAHLLSRWRPSVPAYAYTSESSTFRRLALWHGIQPALLAHTEKPDAMLTAATEDLLARRVVQHGDHVVVIGSGPLFAEQRTSYVALHTVGGA